MRTVVVRREQDNLMGREREGGGAKRKEKELIFYIGEEDENGIGREKGREGRERK